jgi:hypothetical protein
LTDISEVLTAFITRVMMKAVSTSEMLVSFCKSTWRNNPEDNHLLALCCENLKSHTFISSFAMGIWKHKKGVRGREYVH